jgi:hypothetical protein
MFETILGELFSLPTIVFAVVIYLQVLLFRKLTEAVAKRVAHVFPDKWEGFWIELWREWVLPAAPVVFGGLTAYLIVQYPYPEIFASSDAGRFFFGIVAGLAAAYVYPRVLYYYKKFLPETVANALPNPEQISNEDNNS